jgi:hypothetical protein
VRRVKVLPALRTELEAMAVWLELERVNLP